MQLAYPCARANRDRRIGLGRGNTEQFGIAAGMAMGFRPAQGQVIGANSLALKGGPQLCHYRLNRPGGRTVIPLAGGLGGIHPSLTMDPVAAFSPVVIGGEICIGQLPGRGRALLQTHAAKLLFTHALKHAPPNFGISPQAVEHLGRKGIAIGTKPGVLRMETLFPKQFDARAAELLWRDRLTPLEHQDRAAAIGQFRSQGGTAGTRADHDDVVVAILNDHG